MQIEQWMGCLKQGNTPHAVLLYGSEGSGLNEYAREAAALYLKGQRDVSLLRDCPMYLEQQGDAADDVRDNCKLIHQEAFHQGRRVLFFPDIHKMKEGNQNYLLKTIEEPPEGTLILLAGSLEAVLPTVRSRCMPVLVGAEPLDRVEQRLLQQGVEPKLSRLCASLSDGYYGAAVGFAQEPFQAFRLEAISLLEALLFSVTPFAKAGELIKEEVDKRKKASPQKLLELSKIWGSLLRDALQKQVGSGRFFNIDQEKLIAKIAQAFTSGQLQGMIERILEAQKQLYYKNGPSAVLDLLLLGMKE